MLAPNKQNLLLLKKQKNTYKNGHKLLQEKRNGLILSFLNLSRKGKEMEQKMSKDLSKILSLYDKNLSFISAKAILDNLTNEPAVNLTVKKKRLSGVQVQDLQIEVNPPKREIFKQGIRTSLEKMGQYLPTLLELVQLRQTCASLGIEILKTGRQISAIEGRIEETEAQVKWIKSTLDEKSNLEKSILITIFG